MHERTNVRSLTPDAIGGPVELTVADLSFISLRLVLPALAGCTAADGDLVPMVKPQFEVGRDRVGAGGVVRDPRLRADAVLDVAAAAAELGLGVAGVVASPLPGPSGNVEFFLWLRRGRARRSTQAAVLRRPAGSGVVSRTALLVTHTGRRDSTAARPYRRRGPDRGRLHGTGDGRRGGRAGPARAWSRSARPDAAEGAEMVFALGGDGTLLRAAELARPAQVPLLGINLGKVGFLAEAEIGDLDLAVRLVVAREYTVEERLTLDVTAELDGVPLFASWALNEASVEKGARERMLELRVDVDGRPLSRYGCDGVVCATPTGSTAYAFSAGGPVVWPGVEALLLVPISAHALFSRALVAAPTSHHHGHHRPARPGRGAVLRRPAGVRPAAGERGHGAAGGAAGAGRPAAAAARSPTGWWRSSGCRWSAGGACRPSPRRPDRFEGRRPKGYEPHVATAKRAKPVRRWSAMRLSRAPAPGRFPRHDDRHDPDGPADQAARRSAVPGRCRPHRPPGPGPVGR